MITRSFTLTEHWASYRYMPMLSSEYRRQRFSSAELLNGSLSPGNGCRIRCFSKILNASEVTGITEVNGGPVWVQVSRFDGDLLTGFSSGGSCSAVEGDPPVAPPPNWAHSFPPDVREVTCPRPGHVHTPTDNPSYIILLYYTTILWNITQNYS